MCIYDSLASTWTNFKLPWLMFNTVPYSLEIDFAFIFKRIYFYKKDENIYLFVNLSFIHIIYHKKEKERENFVIKPPKCNM